MVLGMESNTNNGDKMTKTETWNLRAFALYDTYAVEDAEGGIWHPGEDAQAMIAASNDPDATAIRLAADKPMLGEWAQ
jgi:hypothetical protein